VLLKDPEEPATYQQAKESLSSSDWLAAMNRELKVLEENDTWKVVPKPQKARVLRGKWVYKIKRPADKPIRYKARWVVKGYEQIQGQDYYDTFAGVVKANTLKVLWAIAATQDWEIEQMDAISAFTQGEIDEPMYVELPPGYPEFAASHHNNTANMPNDAVCLLNKALYGLKQSANLWQKKVVGVLAKLGFYPLNSDECVFRNPKTRIVITTYVDDFLLFGRDPRAIKQVKKQLSGLLSVDDMGPVYQFCGTRIIRDRQNRTIQLVQDQYIRRVLKSFGMDECSPVATPFESGGMVHMVPSTEEADPQRTEEYQSIVGSGMFGMTQTRVDIAWICSILSRFNANPSPQHLKAAKRLLRYLRGTETLGITYRGNPDGFLGIKAYSDSDYAGDLETRRSTTGYVIFMANGPVIWKSARQKAVTLSSTEAEYYALSNVAREAAWLYALLTELGYAGPDLRPLQVNGDNQGSLYLAENPQYHQKTKHIDVQYHYVRQEVRSNHISLHYVPTDQMPADGLTKPLTKENHLRFLGLLGLESKLESKKDLGSQSSSD
jgi:hypothetical protein